jgi:hypothetical protein
MQIFILNFYLSLSALNNSYLDELEL